MLSLSECLPYCAPCQPAVAEPLLHPASCSAQNVADRVTGAAQKVEDKTKEGARNLEDKARK